MSLCVSACSPPFESSTHSGASNSNLPPVSRILSGYRRPASPHNNIHPPHIGNAQVPIPRAQRAGVAIAPFDTPDLQQYADGFLAIPNPGTPPIPPLRPASWGSPSQVEEVFERRRLTRSRSSNDFQGDSSGEEDLPFGRRTLPPLPIPYDPWRLGIRATPNIESTPPRDLSPDSGDLSTTNSVSSTSFHTNYTDGGYK